MNFTEILLLIITMAMLINSIFFLNNLSELNYILNGYEPIDRNILFYESYNGLITSNVSIIVVTINNIIIILNILYLYYYITLPYLNSIIAINILILIIAIPFSLIYYKKRIHNILIYFNEKD